MTLATSAAVEPDKYYKMPPVGITTTRVRIGKELREMFTIRCGADTCWFVGHGPSKDEAQSVLNEHECPTPPQRNELPSGRSILEKTWDELDDVMDAFYEGGQYNGFAGEKLQGYARGIAFTLSMMTHPYFRTSDDIIHEAVARRKMRTGEIPKRETPSYRYNPMPSATPNAVKTEPAKKQTPAAKKMAARKAAPLAPLNKTIDVDESTMTNIKLGVSSGMFTHEQVAEIYKVPVEVVRKIVD